MLQTFLECGQFWNCVYTPSSSHIQFSLVQFSRSVVSDSLWPHESQHARPPCPSPTPRVYSNSSPSSWWCHPTISSSVISFSSCPQILLTSGLFPMSQLSAWGGQSTGVSASAAVTLENCNFWDFPGTPVVRMLSLLRFQIWSLAGELRGLPWWLSYKESDCNAGAL